MCFFISYISFYKLVLKIHVRGEYYNVQWGSYFCICQWNLFKSSRTLRKSWPGSGVAVVTVVGAAVVDYSQSFH